MSVLIGNNLKAAIDDAFVRMFRSYGIRDGIINFSFVDLLNNAGNLGNENINIIDFGADPTGEVDSSTAIQAAIDSVHPLPPYSSRGTTINVPFGEYKVSRTIY